MSNDPYEDLNDWLAGPDTCAPPDEEEWYDQPPDEPEDPNEDWDSEEAEFQRQEREAKQAVANLRQLLSSSYSTLLVSTRGGL